METVTFQFPGTGKVVDACVINDVPSLVWAAQIAAVELHPYLGRVDHLDRPTAVVLDMDPGHPATVVDCCRVALRARELLDDLGLRAWAKTSGGVGLHVYVPLNSPARYDETKAFARALTHRLERETPELVTSRLRRAGRAGKVLVDWSQNDFGKSTVAAWSLRGGDIPTVSVPLRWDEVAAAAAAGDPSVLPWLPDAALERAATGDLFAPVLGVEQALGEGYL